MMKWLLHTKERNRTTTLVLPQRQIFLFLRAITFTTVAMFGLVSALHANFTGQKSDLGEVGIQVDSLGGSSSQYGDPTGLENLIRIEPVAPDVNDRITITVSGVSSNSCVPKYQSHQVIGYTIRLDAETPPFGTLCLDVITPWSLSAQVGPLDAGTYQVYIYLNAGSIPVLWETISLDVALASTSQTITSDGGELAQDYQGHRTKLSVPPGALPMPTTFAISYRGAPTTTGELVGMDYFFDIIATQTTFTTPLTITVHYSKTALGVIIPGTENLYRWQNSEWSTEEITLTERMSNGLSAQITHLSSFGVLGQSHHLYLPIISD